MAAGRSRQGPHWTANGGVMAAAIVLSALLPFLSLVVVVPCFVSARRAGVSTTPYAIALALNVVAILLVVVGVFLLP
jgi:hypothetical protein